MSELPKDRHPGDPRYPMGSRYDRRRCDYCFRWIGVNVRRQHYRVCKAKARAEKDAKLGVKPLGHATCDECELLAVRRWYGRDERGREYVAYTLCEKHNDEMLARNAAERERLGLAPRPAKATNKR